MRKVVPGRDYATEVGTYFEMHITVFRNLAIVLSSFFRLFSMISCQIRCML
jgi:hypothetical protein